MASAIPAAWHRLQAAGAGAGRLKRRTLALVRRHGPLDSSTSAEVAGLRHVNDGHSPGIRRLGPKKHFRYLDSAGRPLKKPADLQRIRALAIPPAWTDVWICPNPAGHIQATGRDARGRKQYRYHPRWRQVRDEVKYGRLIAFASALPRIRGRARTDLKRTGLPREKVLAAIVQLLEKALIRVGNEEYAKSNGSIGLTTMRDAHAIVGRSRVTFDFRGKSGVKHTIDVEDARLARIVKACRDLPGYELFQYVDRDGRRQVIDSADVNAYLREISGEAFTAKDFRTWAGTVLAAHALAELAPCDSRAKATRNVVKAIESVARKLGNTKSVCRKCYIHPAIVDAYLEGITIGTVNMLAAGGLSGDERGVVAIVEGEGRRKTA